MTYCSPIWRQFLINDIISLERVQRRATKFILNNYATSATDDYKERLLKLDLLPLMMIFELADLCFFIKFDVDLNHVRFSRVNHMRISC